MSERQTNKEYAWTNTAFISACEAAGLPATPRQASKYRRKRGLAYKRTKRTPA